MKSEEKSLLMEKIFLKLENEFPKPEERFRLLEKISFHLENKFHEVSRKIPVVGENFPETRKQIS